MEHKQHTNEEHLEHTAVMRDDSEDTTDGAIAQIIRKENKREWMLPASILIAAVMISSAFIYTNGTGNTTGQAGDTKKQVQEGPKLTEKDAVLGNADAPITIIEYGDFQCPGCVSFFMAGEPLIKKDLVETGKAKFVFRPYPIVDQIVGKGTESVDSSMALLCAQDQGKFWDMHTGIYTAEAKDEEKFSTATSGSPEGNGNLNRALFMTIAKAAGMDTNTFATCYDTQAHKADLDAIVSQGVSVGVQGTPSLFVNGEQLDMSRYRSWQEAVDYIKTLAK